MTLHCAPFSSRRDLVVLDEIHEFLVDFGADGDGLVADGLVLAERPSVGGRLLQGEVVAFDGRQLALQLRQL